MYFMLISHQFGLSFTRERRVSCQHSSIASDFDDFDTMGSWKGYEDPSFDILLEAKWVDAIGMLDLSFCEIEAWRGGVAVCSQPLYNGHWMEERVSYKLHSIGHTSHVTLLPRCLTSCIRGLHGTRSIEVGLMMCIV